MVRYIACVAVALFVGATLRAGELDGEFGPKAPVAPAKDLAMQAGAAVAMVPAPSGMAHRKVGSELDQELPSQSWRRGSWGWGWHGGWRGWGWGGWRVHGWGWGWRGWGWGYPAWGWGYPVYGGWGYPVWAGCW
jgi:hypothetical protein